MTLKKVFRKIHLWLSIPAGIFIAIICFTGAAMVFEKEITEWCRHDLYFVDNVKEQPLSLELLMDRVSAGLPDSVSVTGVTVFPEADRAYQVSLSKPRRASLYVDQYTGEIKGSYERLPFFDTVFRLHRWLLGSSTGVGKWIVGICTLLLVVILLTGILMWLTNRKKPLTMSLKISFNKGWHRFWHDLHVAGGIYATIFLLALALTGLTWSFGWYRTGFYSLFGVEASAGGHGAPKVAEVSQRGDRQQRGEGVHRHSDADRRGGEGEGARKHGDGEHRRNRNRDAAQEGVRAEERQQAVADQGNDSVEGAGRRHFHSPYRNWQAVCDELAQKNPGFRQITVSDGSAAVVPAGRISLRATDNYSFSRRNGEITDCKPYSAQDKGTKVRSGVYMVHVGSWGGIITRIITFLAALIGFTLPLTGYYLWIRRKMHPKPQKSGEK